MLQISIFQTFLTECSSYSLQ